MSDFFGTIYCWLESLFGQYLADHLWGYNCVSQSFDLTNIFNQIGLLTTGITLLFVIIYYYLINHPRFANWKSWVFMVLFTGVINLFLGYGRTANDFYNGNIGDCLMYVRDDNGIIINELINISDCWGFGAANTIVSIAFFILFSLILKWWSGHAKHSPF